MEAEPKETKMNLTDTQWSLICNALGVARHVYLNDAQEAVAHPRIKEQFERQERECSELIELIQTEVGI